MVAGGVGGRITDEYRVRQIPDYHRVYEIIVRISNNIELYFKQ